MIDLKPNHILRLLEQEYGPVAWEPRYDPISELVFTVLSQHTSDLNSEKAYGRLFAAFGDWAAVAQASIDAIAKPIEIGGLAQIKAPRIKAILQKIIELRGSLDINFLKDMPLTESKYWLNQLPGVGPKTAAVVLCFAFGLPAMPVDTHVHRMAKRLGFISLKTTAEQAHDLLEQVIEPDKVFAFHVYLITHGRRICKALRPMCEKCSLENECPSSIIRHTKNQNTKNRSNIKSSSNYHVEPEDR
jgi:endonuclease-3